DGGRLGPNPTILHRVRARSRDRARTSAGDAEALAMQADVFRRHGSFAIFLLPRATCGYSLAYWARLGRRCATGCRHAHNLILLAQGLYSSPAGECVSSGDFLKSGL